VLEQHARVFGIDRARLSDRAVRLTSQPHPAEQAAVGADAEDHRAQDERFHPFPRRERLVRDELVDDGLGAIDRAGMKRAAL